MIDPAEYDWEGDKPLNRPIEDTIVYEMHVRGFTKAPTSKVK
jgi:isoamylase